jgi:hypothetical protein
MGNTYVVENSNLSEATAVYSELFNIDWKIIKIRKLFSDFFLYINSTTYIV